MRKCKVNLVTIELRKGERFNNMVLHASIVHPDMGTLGALLGG